MEENLKDTAQQEHKDKKFEKVLVARDDKTGQYSLFSQGEDNLLHLIPFNEKDDIKENGSILSFDSRRNFLENFLVNFRKQYKDPTLLKVFTVPIGSISKGINNISQWLEKNDYQSKEELGKRMVLNDGFYPNTEKPVINASHIDWESLNKMGVSMEYLMNTGELTKLLNMEKTSLLSVGIPFNGELHYTEARLYLKRNGDKLTVGTIPLRKEVDLKKPFMGHEFTVDQKERLIKEGHLGEPLVLKDKDGNLQTYLVSVDYETNTLSAIHQERVYIPERIGERILTDTEREQLREGKSLLLNDLIDKTGKTYSATVTYDANERKLGFSYPKNSLKASVQQERKTAQEMISETTSLCGHQLTEEEKKRLINGEKVLFKDLQSSKKGVNSKFDAYVSFSTEKNRFIYDFVKQGKTVKQSNTTSKKNNTKKSTRFKV